LAIILVVGWFFLTPVGTGIELSGTLQKLIRPAFLPAGLLNDHRIGQPAVDTDPCAAPEPLLTSIPTGHIKYWASNMATMTEMTPIETTHILSPSVISTG
jgi:hypothetical protein